MLAEIRGGADVVIVARDDTSEIDFRLLQQAIRSALEGHGLLKTEDATAGDRRDRSR